MTNYESDVALYLRQNRISHGFELHPEVKSASDRDRLPFPKDKIVKTLVVECESKTVFLTLNLGHKMSYRKVSGYLGVECATIHLMEAQKLRQVFGVTPETIGPVPVFDDVIYIVDKQTLESNRVYCGCGKLGKTLCLNPVYFTDTFGFISLDIVE